MRTNVHVGDYGFPIRMTIKKRGASGALEAVNLSTVSSHNIYIKKPDGVVLTRTASLVDGGATGIVECTIQSGDINLEGEYVAQWGGTDTPWVGSASPVTFYAGPQIR